MSGSSCHGSSAPIGWYVSFKGLASAGDVVVDGFIEDDRTFAAVTGSSTFLDGLPPPPRPLPERLRPLPPTTTRSAGEG